MTYQKSDFNWENSVKAENNLLADLKQKGLSFYEHDPFIGFSPAPEGYKHANPAKVDEANKMMNFADKPGYLEALQSILNSRSKQQINPGDHEKAVSRMQSQQSGESDLDGTTSKRKKTARDTGATQKSTILGMKPMYAYIIGGVLVALIIAAIYYTLE